MPEIRLLHSRSGTLYYDVQEQPRQPRKGHRLFQQRTPRPSRITISRVAADPFTPLPPPSPRVTKQQQQQQQQQQKQEKQDRKRQALGGVLLPGKLAVSKESTLRFLRRSSLNPNNSPLSVKSQTGANPCSTTRPRRPLSFAAPTASSTTTTTTTSSNTSSSTRVDNTTSTSTTNPSPSPSPESESMMTAQDFLRSGIRPNNRSDSPRASTDVRRPANLLQKSSSGSLKGSSSRTSTPQPQEEKALASAGGVSISVNLAEPMLFLQGFDHHSSSSRSTAMLRGNLHVKVAKTAKIKAVTLKFKGTATTKWPEGIPPKKVEFEETDSLMSHTWPFFNAQFPTAEAGTGADHVRLVKGSENNGLEHGSPYLTSAPMSILSSNNPRDPKRLSLQQQNTYSKSFDGKSDSKNGSSVVAKGYRTFQPGDYYYNFELPLDSRLPESIDVDLGSVRYELEATVERAGAFRGNLSGTKEVILIRAPSEGSLEQVEPIAISRNWEDQLHYDIVISGKSFPLNSKVPIAFKLTPLAKVQCHRIKVFVTENMEYFCSNKRVHRMEPTRKMLLFEKKADGTETSTFSGSTSRVTAGGGVPYDQREAAARGDGFTPQDASNLLGHLESGTNIGPTEMEFNVQLPGCQPQYNDKDKLQKLHFDTTYQNIQVHHWIKIVLRLSRPDTEDPTKRRHFEISIDSPFHILSCRANQQNTALPAYSNPESASATSNVADCNCPGAPRRRHSPPFLPTIQSISNHSDYRHDSTPSTSSSSANSSTASVSAASSRTSAEQGPDPTQPRSMVARPQLAHVNGQANVPQRPIHFLRSPSFNPPAFDAEEPPPLVTPPPQYDDIASPTDGHGLADYFSRLADAYDEESSGSDEDRTSTRSGRVNVPLTPGSPLNRSMELQRTWLPVTN